MAIFPSIAIGLPFFKSFGGVDAQAQAHFDRVIADGGLVPSGLSGVNAFFTTVKSIYATADITTAISVGLDAQVLGYKLGAGAGTTAGQAAQKLYSCSGASGDVEQTTAASQPLLLVHSGANYWFGSGVSGNVIYSNNSLSLTSECDVKCKIEGVTNVGRFVSQDGTNRNFDFFFSNNTTGVLSIRCNAAFATQVNSSVGLGLTSAYSGWVRFTYLSNGVNADVKFYTSSDGTSWTQLGTTQTIVSTGLSFGTCALGVGGNEAGGFNAILGYVYRVLISSVIDGAAQRDFNPNQYNAATSQTQWTSSTGEVWTINTGTAITGYKGVLVDRTIVQSDGVDDRLATGTITTYQFMTRYAALVPYTMDNNGRRIIAGTGAGHLYYNFNTGIVRAYNGIDLDFNAEVINRLQLFTANFNNLVSTALLNNANTATGATGILTSNILSIFSSSSPNDYANANLTTLIHTVSVDTSNNTAIYNYIKSINNNAF